MSQSDRCVTKTRYTFISRTASVLRRGDSYFMIPYLLAKVLCHPLLLRAQPRGGADHVPQDQRAAVGIAREEDIDVPRHEWAASQGDRRFDPHYAAGEFLRFSSSPIVPSR